MDDRQIVDLYWQRDDAAVRETELKYGPFCRGLAYNVLSSHEDAEECVNDTWLSAWNRMPADRPAVLSAFLGCIIRSLAINKIRAKNRIKRGGGQAPLALDELAECVPGGTNPEQALEAKELEAAIGKFVQGLAGTEKHAFVLRYWYLAPISDIAERLGCREARIKSSLFRTRKKLKVYLQEEGLC